MEETHHHPSLQKIIPHLFDTMEPTALRHPCLKNRLLIIEKMNRVHSIELIHLKDYW